MDVCEEEQGSHLMVPSNGKSGILLLQLVLQTMAPWLWSPGVFGARPGRDYVLYVSFMVV